MPVGQMVSVILWIFYSTLDKEVVESREGERKDERKWELVLILSEFLPLVLTTVDWQISLPPGASLLQYVCTVFCSSSKGTGLWTQWIVLVLFRSQGVVIFGFSLGWLCVLKTLCLIAQVYLGSLDWLYTYWLQESVQIYTSLPLKLWPICSTHLIH